MGQQYSRSLFKPRRTRRRGKATFTAEFTTACSPRCDVGIQTDEAPTKWAFDQPECSPRATAAVQANQSTNAVSNDSSTLPRTCTNEKLPAGAARNSLKDENSLSALLDEIIQILEKDVEESGEMCSDLRRRMLEEVEVRQQSPGVLPPASRGTTLTDAAGEREVEGDSADGLLANCSVDSRLSDEEAFLREFEEFEKSMLLMETSTVEPKRGTAAVRQRRGASIPKVSAGGDEGKANTTVLPYENKFWIGCGPDTLKVFKNPKDRRIESIARTSGCRISLRDNIRKNALGQLQQLVVVEAASEMNLRKCTILLDEKFPAFRAGSGRMNCKLDFR